MARELGIGIVPWGPMGAGFLTGTFTSRADFKAGDIRGNHHSKMSEENFDKVVARFQIEVHRWADQQYAPSSYTVTCRYT